MNQTFVATFEKDINEIQNMYLLKNSAKLFQVCHSQFLHVLIPIPGVFLFRKFLVNQQHQSGISADPLDGLGARSVSPHRRHQADAGGHGGHRQPGRPGGRQHEPGAPQQGQGRGHPVVAAPRRRDVTGAAA